MIRSLMRSRPTSRSRKKELCYSELFSEWCEWWSSRKRGTKAVPQGAGGDDYLQNQWKKV